MVNCAISRENVWSEEKVQVNKIYVAGILKKELDREITSDDIMEVKNACGLGNIEVRDMSNNTLLTPEDFPRTGDVNILPIFKAGY